MSVQIQKIEIPGSAIHAHDAADFEEMRKAVYRQTKPDEPTREQRLTELADLVAIKPGVLGGREPLSIHDAVLRALEAHLSLGRIKSIGYRFTLDDQGNVIGIDKVHHLPEDKRATIRARGQAARIGWAPKQNDSSFRIRDGKLPASKIRI